MTTAEERTYCSVWVRRRHTSTMPTPQTKAHLHIGDTRTHTVQARHVCGNEVIGVVYSIDTVKKRCQVNMIKGHLALLVSLFWQSDIVHRLICLGSAASTPRA